MHKLKKIVVAMSLIVPVSAYPLGVGELRLNSALNESLNAEIPLSLSSNDDIGSVSIGIASVEKFDEAGISWHYFLSGIHFNKVSKGNNKYVVELTSNNIVKEPFLDFLLEVRWPNGNIFKSFTVLLDPRTGSYSDFIEPIQAPGNKPKILVAESKNELDIVRNDITNSVPSGKYGPTKRNDSLWGIARKINKTQGQSVEQVMIALYRANPRAFYKKNVNALMAGKTLTIPSSEDINSLSKEQASSEFDFHRNIWMGGGKTNSEPRMGAIKSKKKDKQLILVPPIKEEVKSLVAEYGKKEKLIHKNEELQKRLALLEEKFSVLQKMLAIKDKELAALQDTRFSAELDAITEKENKLAKEKIQADKELNKSELPIKENLVVQPKLEEKKKISVKPKKIQPVSEVVENGIGYLNIMLGGLAFLLLAIGGFFSWRKRQAESEDELDNIFKATGSSALPNGAESQKEGEVIFSESNETALSAKVTEHAKVKESVVDDVLLDADTYLAYGKYDEAEEALRQELKASPDKDSYKLKLLEVFYSSENNEAFDEFVQDLIKAGKRSDLVFWGNVSAMGLGFSSYSELFSDNFIKDEPPEFDLNIDEPVGISADEVMELVLPELDVEASEVEITEFVGNENVIEDEVFTEPEKLDIESFEFKPSSSQETEKIDFNEIKGDISESLDMIDFPTDKSDKNEEESLSLTDPEGLDVFDMEIGDADLSIEKISTDMSSDEGSADLLSTSSEVDIDLSEFSLSGEPELMDELTLDVSSVSKEPGNQQILKNDDKQINDFDFDFSVEGDVSHTSDAEAKNELTLGDDQELTLDSNMIAEINDTGDYETNLDLAKMYVDMGETDAAKELAEDVLENGSDKQKKEAQEVLDHISS